MTSVSSHLKTALEIAKKGCLCEDDQVYCGPFCIKLKYRRDKLLIYDRTAILIDDVRAVFFTEDDGQKELVKTLWKRKNLRPTLIAMKL